MICWQEDTPLSARAPGLVCPTRAIKNSRKQNGGQIA